MASLSNTQLLESMLGATPDDQRQQAEGRLRQALGASIGYIKDGQPQPFGRGTAFVQRPENTSPTTYNLVSSYLGMSEDVVDRLAQHGLARIADRVTEPHLFNAADSGRNDLYVLTPAGFSFAQFVDRRKIGPHAPAGMPSHLGAPEQRAES